MAIEEQAFASFQAMELLNHSCSCKIACEIFQGLEIVRKQPSNKVSFNNNLLLLDSKVVYLWIKIIWYYYFQKFKHYLLLSQYINFSWLINEFINNIPGHFIGFQNAFQGDQPKNQFVILSRVWIWTGRSCGLPLGLTHEPIVRVDALKGILESNKIAQLCMG